MNVNNLSTNLRQAAAVRQSAASKDFRQGNFDRALREADAADSLRRQADALDADAKDSAGSILDIRF